MIDDINQTSSIITSRRTEFVTSLKLVNMVDVPKALNEIKDTNNKAAGGTGGITGANSMFESFIEDYAK